MRYERITCTTTTSYIIIARAADRGADHFYQISVYYYIEDLHTAAEFDFGKIGS